MSGAWIRTRELPPSKRNPKGAKRFQVLYRQGGRDYPIETAGTWATLREAKIRRDVVGGMLAAGLDPKVELAVVMVAPARLSVSEWAARYERSRIDYSPSGVASAKSAIKKLRAQPLAAKAPGDVTIADIQELVGAWMEDGLKASTIAQYMTTVKLIFDFADADPNPARDPRLRLPSVQKIEATPPTGDQFLALLEAVNRRYRLPLVVLEQTGMRVGEVCTLVWGDVDEQGDRFRLRAAATKTRRARWVQVPAWLMGVVSETVRREDRTDDRRVFTMTPAAAAHAMRRACRDAGLPSFSPHDLRHRRGTIWHQDPAITIREQMERGGWARSDIAIDTYSHLHRLDEVRPESLRALLVVTG